jgi:hypothetical protein
MNLGNCIVCEAEATEVVRIESFSANNVVCLCEGCKNYVNWVLTQFFIGGVRFDD